MSEEIEINHPIDMDWEFLRMKQKLSIQKDVIERLEKALSKSMKFYISTGKEGIGWYEESQKAIAFAKEKLE